MRQARSTVTAKLEEMRRAKEIGSSLEAAVEIWPAEKLVFDALKAVETELPEVMITSEAKLIDYNVDADRGGMLSVKYSRTDNHKCGRCWRYLSEVTSDGELCARCDGVVNG